MQSDRLLGDLGCMVQQPQLVDQLVALVLKLAAVRVGIRALLDFASFERIRGIARTGG